MTISVTHDSANIVDIRRGKVEDTIVKDLLSGLQPGEGNPKTLPTLLLYDEAGLKLFERITYLEEYYLTNEEIEVLSAHAEKIVERIPAGTLLVELGSGNLRKIDILLKAFDRAGKAIDYYALDLSLRELRRTLAAVPPGTYSHVTCHGFFGTYDDGLAWLSKPENQTKPKCILSLGSSLGNFNRDNAASFLASFARTLQPSDSMLIALDGCQKKEKIYAAYNDREGITHQFYRNGLSHANALLGHEAFKQEDWDVVGTYNPSAHRHEAYFSPMKEVSINGVSLGKGEMIRFEEAHKYSGAQAEVLWHRAGLNEITKFGNKTDDYHIHMLSSPNFSWPIDPKQYATNPVPSLQDWEGLWKAWDTVSTGMVPRDELLSKPIKLRNACIFYLGHIPTFVDIHLTRATGTKATEPSYYPQIFERGIDPDVDNPELCHAHSEIPDTWPPAFEILEFQSRVRDRVRRLMRSGEAALNPKVSRAMWIGFEHEVMHLETFLYMLLQSDKTLPPAGVTVPNFKAMAARARNEAVPNAWITVPDSTIHVGMDDPENDDGPDRYFGWDNEKPPRTTKVPSFVAQARPITNGEYARYLEENLIDDIPASWSEPPAGHNGHAQSGQSNGTNGHVSTTANASETYLAGKFVRTVFGPVQLKYALDWPLFASYDEFVNFADWMDARIPNADEVRSIYCFVEQARKIKENVLGRTISAVNGHLSNEGVEETPPSRSGVNGFSKGKHRLDPSDLFVDLADCNVGLQNWHPTPVTQNGNRLSGRGDMGGVWEWTSSPLEKHEGFKAMDLYPAYTADFFDRKHNIVLGGSWATHPRVAGRKSFVNWYQRKYPYAWCGARLVRDA